MKPALMLATLAAFSVLSSPASAQNDDTARSMVKPARLIEFTGDREFLKEASRLRVWRQEVGFTLGVGSDGAPIDCKLTNEFRMNYVNDKLCAVLLKHHTFEPAQNASGSTVQGTYEGRLNFLEIREKD